VTNHDDKNKRAAALKYEPDKDSAPKITATGKGLIAALIIDKARENGVPIVENPPLAELLTTIPLGTEIPVELYEVVAEVLVQILALDTRCN